MATIKRVRIYDLDGTVIDSSHRYRTMQTEQGERIDLDYWRANEYRAYEDALLPLHDQYIRDLMDNQTFVIVATARVMHAPDWAFVRDKLGEPDHFISRKDGDTQSGATLKIRGLQKFFNLKPFANADFLFYEDNLAYLQAVCNKFNIRGCYVPSKQGH